jgi:CobQ-like glutamine amidotransferase family enzyme
MRPLQILHLYPRELGINGDVGNVTALAQRARWRSIDVEVKRHDPGDELPSEIDLIHIGSGPLSGQRAVYSDLRRITPLLLDARDSGTPILAIAGGWQLLGRSLVTPEGEELTGAGVFATTAVLSARRTVGEIVVRRDGGIIAGFENHSSTITLDAGATPLGRVLGGGGNTSEAPADERMEGVRSGDSIGTNLHGPLLPMNPQLADELLASALRRRGDTSALDDPTRSEGIRTVDDYAARARAALAARIGVSA